MGRAGVVSVGVVAGGFDAASLAQLLDRLAPIPRSIDPERLARAWDAALAETANDPTLAQLVATTCHLSLEGARAALSTILHSAGGLAAHGLLRSGRERPLPSRPGLAVLAGSVPGLAAQPLLAALAVGRAVLLKSSTNEPFVAPRLVRALVRREPELAESLAAVTWAGGDQPIEEVVAGRVGRTVVYGGGGAVAAWRNRDAGAVTLGPAGSLAVVDGNLADGELSDLASQLAADTALLDQRGCLSLRAVLVLGSTADGERLGAALARALERQASIWPPGPTPLAEAAAANALRLTAAALGLTSWALEPLGAGTVVVDPLAAPLDGPGQRTVLVIPVAGATAALDRLRLLVGRLQAVALAGPVAARLDRDLHHLGAVRTCRPGDLQRPDATWANGGIDPLDLFGASPPESAHPSPQPDDLPILPE